MNYDKTFALVKVAAGPLQPQSVAGIVVKPWVKYLGFLLGNVDTVKLEHRETIAHTWKMTYDMGVQDVRLSSLVPGDGSPALLAGAWRWESGSPCWCLAMGVRLSLLPPDDGSPALLAGAWRWESGSPCWCLAMGVNVRL